MAAIKQRVKKDLVARQNCGFRQGPSCKYNQSSRKLIEKTGAPLVSSANQSRHAVTRLADRPHFATESDEVDFHGHYQEGRSLSGITSTPNGSIAISSLPTGIKPMKVDFAFFHLLGFSLIPRLKGIAFQKIYLSEKGRGPRYPHIDPISTCSINWELIHRQYEEMLKYTTVLKLGTAQAEAILSRFTRNNVQHPTYKVLAERGKVIKTLAKPQRVS